VKVSMTLYLSALLGLLITVGCASTPSSTLTSKFDAKAAEKARPYLANLTSIDFRTGSTGSVCADPKVGSDWKASVAAAGACVQKQDWSTLERLATNMASRETDSPWGAYFLGLAAAGRGEMLRAQWMLDLAEKKAGSPIGLVRYEKARWLEMEEGPAAAVKEMKEAVRIDATLMPALLWLAQLHHRDRMLGEAERYYRQVLALKSDVYPAVKGLADLMFDAKKGPEAAELLNRAIAMHPEVAETRVRLAMVFEVMTKEPARAIEVLRELRVALEKGRARGKVNLDISAKIKSLEQTMKPESTAQAREPAQDKVRSNAVPKKGG
jgi:tetratricopeptide (TPR) repeat protein